LFVSFFPQLVAGPIERPDNLLPQLKETHEPDIENFSLGLQKMAVGFFKKIVVADLLAGYVNAVYNNVNEATALSVVIATVLFAVQIYCDFSGYTDIAIGCARMMGIRLMQNFNRPYTARSIRDFWDRWHISLSTWLRDYLYIPLGGNRVSRPRYYFNLMVVFLASGLWHGADWTFVLWGAVHGIFRIVGSLTRKPRERLWESLGVRGDAPWLVLLQKVNTFALVCFAWIFFRANSIADLGTIFSRLFGAGSWSVSETMTVMGLNTAAIIVTVLSILVLSLLDRVMSRAELETADVASRRMTTVLLVWTVAVAWILLLSVGGASSFIYFQF
ncbi:MAG: MBOAT family protein, partial [Ruminococcus sp.]|nr:MBOAT family protein [Candidatus Apopatosoma intestinale]